MRYPMRLEGSKLKQITRLLVSSIKSDPWVYFWAIALSGAFGAITVLMSRLVGWSASYAILPVLEDGAPAKDRLIAVGLVFFAAATALGLSVAGRRIMANLGVINLMARHRRVVSRQYMRLPLTWHMQHPAGRLLAIAHSDVEAATGIFNPLPFALGVVVMIFVAAYSLLSADLWLGLTGLTIIPLVIAVNLVFQRVMHPAITRAQQLRAEVSDVAHESFEAATLVKSFGAHESEISRFRTQAEALEQANIRVGKVRAIFDPMVDLLPHAGTLAVLVTGMVRFQQGAITDPGVIVSAAFLLAIMALPVRAFGWVISEIPRALVGWNRMAEIVDSPVPSDRRRTDRFEPGPGGLGIECRGVSVEVPTASESSVRILHGVNLTIEPGTTVAVVGQTASGKSTLLRTLMRLLPLTDGTIAIAGHDYQTIRDDDYTALVSLITQEAFVFEDTVRGNVTVGVHGDAHVADAQVWAALEQASIAEFVRELPGQLDAILGERGANLSGGQRQRIAIARALFLKPRLLMLDDATSAVDPSVEQRILHNLTATHETAGTDRPTVVIVAYRLSSIMLADTIAVMHEGQIIAQGTHDELIISCRPYQDIASAYARDAELGKAGGNS